MLLGRLQALGPLIADICRIAGTPGLSLGVLHNGKVVHQASVGFRDVDARLPSEHDTVYLISSLTKAFTAAMVGILVEDGKLNWTTQLQDVIPEFKRGDATRNITIADMLSHRTGLPSYDSLWLLSDNRLPLGRAEAIPILSYVPVAAPLRTEYLYNNIAYETLGQVIEKVSGSPYATFLQDRILGPLGMLRTFYTDYPTNDPNAAAPYIALRNATPFQVPQPVYGGNVLLGAAGGIRSSTGDLLLLYNALIDAAYSQINHLATTVPQNPLKQLDHIWRGMVSLPAPTFREFSYASGWFRAQLPAPLADYGPGTDPMLGEGVPSRLGLFHGGQITGFTSFAAVFPETSSAIIVLSNSLALTDTTRLVGQLLIEELFSNTINATSYIEYAKSTSRQSASFMSNIKKELLRDRTVEVPAYPLRAYAGSYYNSIGNFFIEIRETAADTLRIYFMGLESDGFDLEPYQHDSFFWYESHDNLVQRARFTSFPKEYYVIHFDHIDSDNSDAEPNINGLRWKHEFSLPGDGEHFEKRHRTPDSPGSCQKQLGVYLIRGE